MSYYRSSKSDMPAPSGGGGDPVRGTDAAWLAAHAQPGYCEHKPNTTHTPFARYLTKRVPGGIPHWLFSP